MRVVAKIAVQASRSPAGFEHHSTAASITVALSVRWGHQTVSSFNFRVVSDVRLRGARLTEWPKKVRCFVTSELRRGKCDHAKTCQFGARAFTLLGDCAQSRLLAGAAASRH